jgi:hypothetical protein
MWGRLSSNNNQGSNTFEQTIFLKDTRKDYNSKIAFAFMGDPRHAESEATWASALMLNYQWIIYDNGSSFVEVEPLIFD